MTSDEHVERAWHFGQLRRSVHGLAQAGSSQPLLFPDDPVTADHLALDFDHWSSFVRDAYGDELSDVQVDSLAALDQKLSTMSRDGAEFDAELWTDAAMRSSEHWADVRKLAVAALAAFGWTQETTSSDYAEDDASTTFKEADL